MSRRIKALTTVVWVIAKVFLHLLTGSNSIIIMLKIPKINARTTSDECDPSLFILTPEDPNVPGFVGYRGLHVAMIYETSNITQIIKAIILIIAIFVIHLIRFLPGHPFPDDTRSSIIDAVDSPY